MSTALVIGGDGLIGNALVTALRRRGVEVVSTTRRPDEARTQSTMCLDLAAPVPDALPHVDVAFICAAMTSFADCRKAPDVARRINFEAPVEIARRLADRGTKIIFLSTSAVLDCREPLMRADRPRAGQSLYGKWKGAAEVAILELGALVSVLRLTKVLTPDAALFRNWLEALAQRETIMAFDDHRVSPIRVQDVVEASIALGEGGHGLYQVSGARDVSYFEMASYLAKALGASAGLVRGCSAGSRGIPPEETSKYTSLDCCRLTALTGFEPPEPDHILRDLFLRQSTENALCSASG